MGFNLGRALVGVGTLGASEVYRAAANKDGNAGRAALAAGTLGASELGNSAIQGTTDARASIYGNPSKELSAQGGGGQYVSKEDPQSQIRNIYGSEAANLSGGVERYMSGLRGNLDKNVANADIYNQEAGRERGIAKARAGLSNTDTSAADEQARRNSIYGAAAINETAKRDANTAYGKGVGNIISGVNRIEQQAKANAIASQPVPVAQENSGGLLDSLFGWL